MRRHARAAALAALILAAMPAAAAQESAEQAARARIEQAMRAGEQAFAKGQFRQALVHYEDAAADDASGYARYKMAVTRLELGEAAAAQEDLRLVLGKGTNEEVRQIAYLGLSSMAADHQRAGDPASAEEIYRRLFVVNPLNRDMLHNYAVTLYQQGKWDALEDVAERLVRMDPLGENGWLLLYNGRKGRYEAAAGDPAQAKLAETLRASALAALERADGMPVRLTNPVMSGEYSVNLEGRIAGHAATPGSRCTITFRFLALGQEIGTASVPVTAPAKGEEVTVSAKATTGRRGDSFRYAMPECDGWKTTATTK